MGCGEQEGRNAGTSEVGTQRLLSRFGVLQRVREVMGKGRQGRARSAAAAVTAAVLLGACSGAGASDPPGSLISPSSAPAAAEKPAWTTPALSPTPSTPEQQAIALYTQQYLPLVEQVMEARQPDDPRLAEVAADLGLSNGRNPAVSLLKFGTTAEGQFLPSIQRVEVKNPDTVELVDCQRRDFVHRNAQTGQVVDPGGQRHEVFVTVRRLDGRWKVAHYMPVDRCVPKELADQVLTAYRRWEWALREAEGMADPDHPGLEETMAGEQLSWARKKVTEYADEGRVRRDFSRSHPEVIRIRDYDKVAIIRDCMEGDPRTGLYDPKTGERVSQEQVAPGSRYLGLAQLELIGGAWKVVAFESKGQQGCKLPGE